VIGLFVTLIDLLYHIGIINQSVSHNFREWHTHVLKIEFAQLLQCILKVIEISGLEFAPPSLLFMYLMKTYWGSGGRAPRSSLNTRWS
jgi:hypothetical protein